MTTTSHLLSCIELTPATEAVGTVILLHGLGADGNDFVPIVPELHLPKTLPLNFVFPNAPQRPVTINNGYVMPAWYDIQSMDIHGRSDQAGIQQSVAQLNALIEHQEAKGIPANKIVLAGFSQGAVIALTAGLQFPKKLAGIMALSGYFPFADKVFANNTANKNTPIFLGHGTQDAIVAYSLGLLTQDALNNQGLPVTWKSYPMAHSVCAQEIKDISEWLVKLYLPL